jgi:hypothetical protein
LPDNAFGFWSQASSIQRDGTRTSRFPCEQIEENASPTTSHRDDISGSSSSSSDISGHDQAAAITDSPSNKHKNYKEGYKEGYKNSEGNMWNSEHPPMSWYAKDIGDAKDACLSHSNISTKG